MLRYVLVKDNAFKFHRARSWNWSFFAPWPRHKAQGMTNNHLLNKTTTPSPSFKCQWNHFLGRDVHPNSSIPRDVCCPFGHLLWSSHGEENQVFPHQVLPIGALLISSLSTSLDCDLCDFSWGTVPVGLMQSCSYRDSRSAAWMVMAAWVQPAVWHCLGLRQ